MKQVIIENPVIYLTEVANKYGDAWIENKLREAKARILITNFHAFKLRERNGAGKLTKAILSQGGESPFTETPDQMVRRVCRELGTKKNIIVINDEAHHCYRRRVVEEDIKLTGDERKEAKKREEEARVWISGLESARAKIGIRVVYDLSATPFFLRGSGYPEGTLFPWVVSDFSLISEQLESGEAMSADFKKIATTEIEEFKTEYRARFPGRDAESLTDEDLLREVMNTVGKAGKLGEQVKCVVSVSMLTEGWDANTVTHILGVRAFGTQLLCEQVVGRGLRRMSYATNQDGKFEPEYAEVYGVPFSFIPCSGSSEQPKPGPTPTRVRALEDRISCEITFPRVDGYRYELPSERITAKFTDASSLALSTADIPTKVQLDTIRPVYSTRPDKCHISHVVADTTSWEQKMASALEEMDEVFSYVKNQSLGFTIPYILNGEEKNYYPDFIVRIKSPSPISSTSSPLVGEDRGEGGSGELNLIIEVTGEHKKDKTAKVSTAKTLWIPAINNHGGFGCWAFFEISDPWNAKNEIRAHLSSRNGTVQ